MPRMAQTHVEDEVFSRLDGYKGGELMLNATLRTLFTVRNAVYRYNRDHKRDFRCTIEDDGVRVAERPKKSVYQVALKAVGEAFKLAQQENAHVDTLVDRVEDVIRTHFAKPEPDGDEGEYEDEQPEVKRVEPIQERRRRRA